MHTTFMTQTSNYTTKWKYFKTFDWGTFILQFIVETLISIKTIMTANFPFKASEFTQLMQVYIFTWRPIHCVVDYSRRLPNHHNLCMYYYHGQVQVLIQWCIKLFAYRWQLCIHGSWLKSNKHGSFHYLQSINLSNHI